MGSQAGWPHRVDLVLWSGIIIPTATGRHGGVSMSYDYVSDRRAYKRKPCLWRGDCTFRDGTYHGIKVMDVSPGGARALSPNFIPINSYIKMGLATAKGFKLAIEGKVCWCEKLLDGFGIGVYFDKALPYSLENIL